MSECPLALVLRLTSDTLLAGVAASDFELNRGRQRLGGCRQFDRGKLDASGALGATACWSRPSCVVPS